MPAESTVLNHRFHTLKAFYDYLLYVGLMMPSRREILVVGTAALCAGCTDIGVGSESNSRETPTETTDTPTSEPVPDLRVENEQERTVNAEITVERVSEDDDEVFMDEVALDPDGVVDLYDVYPDSATYRFTVELESGLSQTIEIETEKSRFSIVSIRIENDIQIIRLNVHPHSTPTNSP